MNRVDDHLVAWTVVVCERPKRLDQFEHSAG